MEIKRGCVIMTISFRYCGENYEITYATTAPAIVDMSMVRFRIKKFMTDIFQRNDQRPFRQSLVEDLRFISI